MNSKGMAASAAPVYQEFEPSIEWVTEDDCNTLLLYLPGFAKEQLRVQLRSRTLIISGVHKLNENTWSRFRKEFLVPEQCDVNKISAKFEGSILFVKQPKLITPVAKQEENPPLKAPAPKPENPMDEPKLHQNKTEVEPDTKLTSTTQPNKRNGDGKKMKDGSEKDVDEKDGSLVEKDGELKEPKGVRGNASKKKASDSGFVMKLKPSRSAVNKVFILVVGFVVGVYFSNAIKSLIA